MHFRREEEAERRRLEVQKRREEKRRRELEMQKREQELEKQRVDRAQRMAELQAQKERELELERIAEAQRKEEERLAEPNGGLLTTHSAYKIHNLHNTAVSIIKMLRFVKDVVTFSYIILEIFGEAPTALIVCTEI